MTNYCWYFKLIFYCIFADKAREILKVTTGVSEYNDRIGKLGTHVIENKLHGEIKDAEYCKIWEKIQLKNVGEPYKVIPPYPTQT